MKVHLGYLKGQDTLSCTEPEYKAIKLNHYKYANTINQSTLLLTQTHAYDILTKQRPCSISPGCLLDDLIQEI